MSELRTDHPFSLTRGGPFYHLLRRVRLVDPRGDIRWPWLVAIAWLPMITASLVRLAIGGRPDLLVFDPSVHARCLIALPLLILAERILETRCRSAAELVRHEGLTERTAFDAILDRTEHLRDTPIVEGVLASAVLVIGQAAVWGLSGQSALIHGIDPGTSRSFAGLWYLAVTSPLIEFLMLRWLWRWGLWTYVLVRLSRRALATNALHPDRAAGLHFLSSPIDGFAMFVASVATVASSAWLAQLARHRTTLQALEPSFFGFIVVAIVIACGPLLLFVGQLYQARHRDVSAFHALACEYVREFRRKWIAERGSQPLLGTDDLQALNDLGGSFQTADRTRIYPFGVRTLLDLCAGAAIPMVPLLLVAVPISEIALRLGKTLFGI